MSYLNLIRDFLPVLLLKIDWCKKKTAIGAMKMVFDVFDQFDSDANRFQDATWPEENVENGFPQ